MEKMMKDLFRAPKSTVKPEAKPVRKSNKAGKD
jgi:hypothetical protein